MKGISGPALFITGEWCIDSLNMYTYITWERTCPIACHIDSGVSYESPARSIWRKKSIRKDGTPNRLRAILTPPHPRPPPPPDALSRSRSLNLLASIDQGYSVCTCSRFLCGSRVWNDVMGKLRCGVRGVLPLLTSFPQLVSDPFSSPAAYFHFLGFCGSENDL